MSMTTRAYEHDGGRAGGLRRVDGPAPSQAPITLSLGVEPVPALPKAGPGGHYPKGCNGTASASTVFRDDLLFVKVDNQNVLTSAGITTHGCKASMGNEAKPEVGREDDWCSQWMFMGLAKNTLTNPEDGNYGATGGYQRASSTMEAVQTAGSHSIKYTGKHPIHAGQLIVFHEPPTDQNYDKRDSRPLPTLGPLDWTRLVANPLHSINITMLDMQQNGLPANDTLDVNTLLDSTNYSGGETLIRPKRCEGCGVEMGIVTADPTWEHAALQRKRSILTEGVALISVLAKRGYIKILDSDASWREACTEKYVAKTKSLVEKLREGSSYSAEDLEDDMKRCLLTYIDELQSGLQEALENEHHSHREQVVWCYDVDNERVVPTYPNNYVSWLQHFLVSREVTRHLSYDETQSDLQQIERGLAWLIRVLGLGNASAEEEHTATVLEILKLCCKTCLDPLSTADLVATSAEIFSAKSFDDELEETMSSFGKHLENYEVGLASTIFKIQDRVNRRIVGLSMSSVPGGATQNMPGGTEPVLDLILGVRTI